MFARQIVKAIVPAVQNAQKRGISVIAGKLKEIPKIVVRKFIYFF